MSQVVKSAADLTVGEVILTGQKEPNERARIVRITKNSVQVQRCWYRDTYFIKKVDPTSGLERRFRVENEQGK